MRSSAWPGFFCDSVQFLVDLRRNLASMAYTSIYMLFKLYAILLHSVGTCCCFSLLVLVSKFYVCTTQGAP